jgi:hypothetical protein
MADEGHDDLLVIFADQTRAVTEIRDMLEDIDLVSADNVACIRFRALRRLHLRYAVLLIEMIEEHGESLRERLEAAIRDS